MTIKNILESVLGVGQVAFLEFPEKVAPPYAVYYSTGADTFAADNIAYFQAIPINIELYTDLKDIGLEKRIETALTENEIFYTKSETGIPSEKVYQVLYEIEVKTLE